MSASESDEKSDGTINIETREAVNVLSRDIRIQPAFYLSTFSSLVLSTHLPYLTLALHQFPSSAIVEHFKSVMKADPSLSEAVAAIKTLLQFMRDSKGINPICTCMHPHISIRIHVHINPPIAHLSCCW